MIPTFNGEAIFGKSYSFWPNYIPNDLQITGYPAVNGLDCMNLGERGIRIEGTCLLFADSDIELGGIIAGWRTLKRLMTPGTLVDVLGDAYDNCILYEFYPTEQLETGFVPGGVSREFKFTFWALNSFTSDYP